MNDYSEDTVNLTLAILPLLGHFVSYSTQYSKFILEELEIFEEVKILYFEIIDKFLLNDLLIQNFTLMLNGIFVCYDNLSRFNDYCTFFIHLIK